MPRSMSMFQLRIQQETCNVIVSRVRLTLLRFTGEYPTFLQGI